MVFFFACFAGPKPAGDLHSEGCCFVAVSIVEPVALWKEEDKGAGRKKHGATSQHRQHVNAQHGFLMRNLVWHAPNATLR